jgi:hypothetical protein
MCTRKRFGVDEALARILEDSEGYESSGEENLDGNDDLDDTDLRLPVHMMNDDLDDERACRDVAFDDDSDDEWDHEDLIPLARLASTSKPSTSRPKATTPRPYFGGALWKSTHAPSCPSFG